MDVCVALGLEFVYGWVVRMLVTQPKYMSELVLTQSAFATSLQLECRSNSVCVHSHTQTYTDRTCSNHRTIAVADIT